VGEPAAVIMWGMSEPYNRFTGQSLEHLTALSDGLFAVAMTLLVLDLRVPVSTAATAYSEHGLWVALPAALTCCQRVRVPSLSARRCPGKTAL
jgi:transmembrane protein TMEM174 (potassium channel)